MPCADFYAAVEDGDVMSSVRGAGGRIMGSQSDRDIFRRNNPQLSERSADEAWRNGGVLPRIELNGNRELTWKDFKTVMGGALGKVALPCPYC